MKLHSFHAAIIGLLISMFIAGSSYAQNLTAQNPGDYLGKLAYQCSGPLAVSGTTPLTRLPGERPIYQAFEMIQISQWEFGTIMVALSREGRHPAGYLGLCLAWAFAYGYNAPQGKSVTLSGTECEMLVPIGQSFVLISGTPDDDSPLRCELTVIP